MLSCRHVLKPSLPSSSTKRGLSILLYKYSIVIHGKPPKHFDCSLDIEGSVSFPKILLLLYQSFFDITLYPNISYFDTIFSFVTQNAKGSSRFPVIRTCTKILPSMVYDFTYKSYKWMRPRLIYRMSVLGYYWSLDDVVGFWAL